VEELLLVGENKPFKNLLQDVASLLAVDPCLVPDMPTKNGFEGFPIHKFHNEEPLIPLLKYVVDLDNVLVTAKLYRPAGLLHKVVFRFRQQRSVA
jgi:hypothetical protein